MSFPAPDIGVARFPGPDTGIETFPRPDVGRATFPPTPIPVIFIVGESVVDILSEGVAIGVPWNVFETVVDISSAATVISSVEILTSTTVDILSTVQRVFDVVTSETVVDISSAATVAPSPTASSSTSVDITSAAIVGTPAAIVLTQTTVDIMSDVISIPVTSFTGMTTVDIASTATAIPVGVINSNTSVDIASTGAIVTFTASGMTKNGSWVPTANGAWIVVPAWTADSGSTVAGNGVQARGAKANAVVSGQLSIAAAVGAYQVSVRLKVDGVVVKTITDYPLAGFATTNVPIASDPMAVTAGQVATIECWFVNFSNSFTVQSGANTYVRIT